ncbi:MAG: hypothetical protein ACO1SV_16675 [Fimbriimonas sp.]
MTYAREMKELPVQAKWALFIGAVALASLAEWAFAGHRILVAANTFLLFPYLLLFAATSVREMGRATAALLVRFRVRSISVHGLILRCAERPFTLQFRKWDLTSLTIATPIGLKDLRKRLLTVIAGGPIANAIVALLSLGMVIVTPGSPWWMIWSGLNAYCALAAFVDLPFRGDMVRDGQEIAIAKGGVEGSRRYLRQYVRYADGVDDEEREKTLRDLGYPYEAAVDRMLRMDRAGDFRGALWAVDDARNHIGDDAARRVYLDCCEASLNASDRLDVSRARELLPPEAAAVAHDILVPWLEASVRIANAERRWADAAELCGRTEALVREGDPDFLRWVQVVGRWAERKAKRSSSGE